jgi:hypothetical protein
MQNQSIPHAVKPEPADREPHRRPGVPMVAAFSPIRMPEPVQQTGEPTSGVGVEVNRLTPVFGTAIPPRGVSGLIRKSAYRIPEHHPGRWLLLMLGDRVDVLEHRVRRNPVAAVSLVAGVFAFLGRRRNRRRGLRTVEKAVVL